MNIESRTSHPLAKPGISDHRHRKTEKEEDEELLNENNRNDKAVCFEESPWCKNNGSFPEIPPTDSIITCIYYMVTTFYKLPILHSDVTYYESLTTPLGYKSSTMFYYPPTCDQVKADASCRTTQLVLLIKELYKSMYILWRSTYVQAFSRLSCHICRKTLKNFLHFETVII